ncbi:MAG: hydrogenase maturation nickel metallochaperone HypA, partial [Spirochaetota bacterium]
KYLEECYPAAVDGTPLQETKLEIEILPANARCNDCSKIFNVVANKNICPECGSKNREIISGKEFMIKEIHAC